MAKSKYISGKKLALLCSNIDKQAIIDACKYIDINGIPFNRTSNGVYFVLFNKKQYPLRYVFEIANNEIINNKTKIGPNCEYNPERTSDFVDALEILFREPPKDFRIATPSNEEGIKIFNKYRKELLVYAKQQGLEVKERAKKHTETYKSPDYIFIEKHIVRYTEILKKNKPIMQIYPYDKYLPLSIRFNYDILDCKHSKLAESLYGEIRSEKELNRVLKIINYVAYNPLSEEFS